ncbi:MAG: GntR family transcriptional regulator [Erysipelotrichaceae bacterium]|nr:GntR family transcriptional regulator [Erysipelotrichaceae bacterium]
MWKLNQNSQEAIYKQIENNIIEYILLGIFEPHQLLPSVRSLSKELGINPNTVQKAYQELETDGYIYFLAGKGTYIADNKQVLHRIRASKLADLANMINEMLKIGINGSDIKKVVIKTLGEDQ